VAYRDGTLDEVVVPAFRGTPANPMTDDELSAVFRTSAEGVLSPGQAAAVLDAAWGLPASANIAGLLALLRVG
jgi:hypothetical protein